MKNSMNDIELSDEQLDEIFEQLAGFDPSRSVEQDVARAREAINMIQRVRQVGDLDTLKATNTKVDDFLQLQFGVADGEVDLPTKIGRFLIRRTIGQGGFGLVLLAHDPNLNRDVALKIPRPEVTTSVDLKKRFIREGKAAAALTHPSIVPVFEAGRHGWVHYIASQFISGQTLAEFAEQSSSQMSFTAAAEIVSRLAEGMEHAHQRGVLHRDLKPSNILVDDSLEGRLSDRVLISDFGLAKTTEDIHETQVGALVGTPAFMSPEQTRSNGAIGPATDIYSLGAILYYLLTGKPPFQSATIVDTISAVRERPVVSLRKTNKAIPKDLEAVCLKCLEKKDTARYSTAYELSQDLNRFLEGRSVAARKISPVVKFSRWFARNTAVATAASLAFLFLALGFAGTFWMYNRSQDNLLESKAQTKIAREQAELAQEQKALANRGLERSQTSINLMLTDVAQALEDVPQMDLLRSRLLTKATALQNEIARDGYEKQYSIKQVLDTSSRMALAQQLLGNSTAAIKTVDEAMAIYDQTPEDEKQKIPIVGAWAVLAQLKMSLGIENKFPLEFAQNVVARLNGLKDSGDDRILICLSQALRQLGINSLNLGKVSEAVERFETAKDILQDVEAGDYVDELRFSRAQCHNSLAIGQRKLGEDLAAAAAYENVVLEMLELVTLYPERIRYKELLAITSLNRGNLLFDLEQFEEAATAYCLSVDICDEVRRGFPQRKMFWNVGAGALTGGSLCAKRLADFDQAEEYLSRSIELWMASANQFGQTVTSQNGLASSYNSMTNLLNQLERFDEAKEAGAMAVSLKREFVENLNSERPGDWKLLSLYIGNLAMVEARIGNHQSALAGFLDALEIAKGVLKKHPTYPRQLANLNTQFLGAIGQYYELGQHEEILQLLNQMAELRTIDQGQLRVTVNSIGKLALMINRSPKDQSLKSSELELYRNLADKLIRDSEDLGLVTAEWLTEEMKLALGMD